MKNNYYLVDFTNKNQPKVKGFTQKWREAKILDEGRNRDSDQIIKKMRNGHFAGWGYYSIFPNTACWSNPKDMPELKRAVEVFHD